MLFRSGAQLGAEGSLDKAIRLGAEGSADKGARVGAEGSLAKTTKLGAEGSTDEPGRSGRQEEKRTPGAGPTTDSATRGSGPALIFRDDGPAPASDGGNRNLGRLCLDPDPERPQPRVPRPLQPELESGGRRGDLEDDHPADARRRHHAQRLGPDDHRGSKQPRYHRTGYLGKILDTPHYVCAKLTYQLVPEVWDE